MKIRTGNPNRQGIGPSRVPDPLRVRRRRIRWRGKPWNSNEWAGGACRKNCSLPKAAAMPRNRPDRGEDGRGIKSANERRVALGETFHKKNIPWVLWTVTRINGNIEPVHVELTKRKDPKTRITISIDTLTNHRYFSPCGEGGPIFPAIHHDGADSRTRRTRARAANR